MGLFRVLVSASKFTDYLLTRVLQSSRSEQPEATHCQDGWTEAPAAPLLLPCPSPSNARAGAAPGRSPRSVPLLFCCQPCQGPPGVPCACPAAAASPQGWCGAPRARPGCAPCSTNSPGGTQMEIRVFRLWRFTCEDV